MKENAKKLAECSIRVYKVHDWYNLDFEDKRIPVELVEITDEGHRYRAGNGQTYFIPSDQVDGLITEQEGGK